MSDGASGNCDDISDADVLLNPSETFKKSRLLHITDASLFGTIACATKVIFLICAALEKSKQAALRHATHKETKVRQYMQNRAKHPFVFTEIMIHDHFSR
jgi:hypothetical protein